MRITTLYTIRLWVLCILFQSIGLPLSMALTSGPSQPEFESFTPVGATDMVNLFTGDFSYNIPLLDVGGYPINLAYNSDIAMDQEASWVGLGWSLNPGSIDRQVRGLPDDFNGDEMMREASIKPDVTVGLGIAPVAEILGIDITPGSLYGSLYYNNYRGIGLSGNISPSFELGDLISIGGTLSGDSHSGGGFSAQLGLGTRVKDIAIRSNLSAGFNTRKGLSDLSLSSNFTDISKSTYRLPSYSMSNSLLSAFSYRPSSELNYTNSSFRFRATAGSEVTFIHPGAEIDGYYSQQVLTENMISSPAYGYLYYQNATEGEKDALMDYNKSSLEMYKKEMPDLPAVYGTYDFFTATGQGINTQFHFRRNDIGVYRPAQQRNISAGGALGIEFGAGGFWHGGGDIDVNAGISQVGPWKQFNAMDQALGFTQNGILEESSQVVPYQNAYFVEDGSLAATDEEYYNQLGSNDPISTSLISFENYTAASNMWVSKNGSSLNGIDVAQDLTREKRSRSITYLTREEAENVGLDRVIYDYSTNTLYCKSCAETGPDGVVITDDTPYPGHHISEITITQADGMRYVYGLPVYNRKHKEVTFSVNHDTDDVDAAFDDTQNSYSTIPYTTTGVNDEINYENGREEYYNEEETPDYVHSFLLTAILSPDYEDKTEDGITDDDIGNAVKFNYSRTSDEYEWRTPSVKDGENYAKYLEGHRADKRDDKATYVYGKREQWYLHSIESRTSVAQFYIYPRKDALGINENGVVNFGSDPEQKSYELKEIRLYSKSDLARDGDAAVPIKSVHFDYDYQLCSGTPNSGAFSSEDPGIVGGKLSLKKVYFTYGNSKAGQLNAYKFDYKSTINGTHAGYRQNKVNRWGFYQDNPNDIPTNMDYPYVVQDPDLQEDFAGLWSLDEIETPSGAKINVTYEPDDYAYVQNKRAGRMFFIKGFASQSDVDLGYIPGEGGFEGKDLYANNGSQIKDYLFVDISDLFEQGIWQTDNFPTDQATLKKLFLKDVNQMYFKALVRLTDREDTYNYTMGYMEIDDDSDIVFDAVSQTLRFRVRSITGENETHPISQAAFQQLRLELPELIYPDVDFDAGVSEVVNAFLAMLGSVLDLFRKFDRKALRRDWGRQLGEDNTSWVRLADPSFNKIGGGSRVAQVTISDEWTEGVGSSVYGQTYTYELEEDILGNLSRDESDCTIGKISNLPRKSSGVASWEPMIGGEENLWKEPIVFQEKIHLAPDNHYYHEKPYLEALYPAPVVGYSRVKVESINNDMYTRSSTGYTISEYYTAKDFPTIVERTRLQKSSISSAGVGVAGINISGYEKLGLSQGFTIETNNMHGQMKRNAVYNAHCQLIESTDYQYKVENENRGEKRLNNNVDVVLEDQSIAEKLIGVDYDVWQEMLEEETYMSAGSVDLNLDVVLTPFPPFTIPVTSVGGSASFSHKQIRTSTTTKHIHRTGILEKVTVNKNGSTLETENLLYDPETGSVVLNQVENEHGDVVYNLNLPAYWAYDGMGHAYRNSESYFGPFKLTGGVIDYVNDAVDASSILTSGDELVLYRDSDNSIIAGRHYVWEDEENGGFKVTDWTGNFTTLPGGIILNAKIIRSGRRNMANLPMQSVQLLQNPIEETLSGFELNTLEGRNILNAQAWTYSDVWNMDCALVDNGNGGEEYDLVEVNFFLSGLKGHWRLDKQWAYYDTERITAVNNDIETVINQFSNGEVDHFNPLWSYNSNSGWQLDDENWIATEEMNYYDRLGEAIQSKDALNVFSSVQKGYNSTLPVGVVGNAELREIGVENFEDYYFDNQEESSVGNFDRHFSLLKNVDPANFDNYLSADHAHSGRFSLEIDSELSVEYPLDGGYCPPTSFNGGGDSRSLVECDEYYDLPGSSKAYYNTCCSCTPAFNAYNGKSYYVSVWVATDASLGCADDPILGSLLIRYPGLNNSGTDVDLQPNGQIIDGWYRISGVIEIPEQAYDIEFVFNPGEVSENDPTISTTYFDDFRMLPEEAAMQAYVYDPHTLRLMAELDDNNYATFYEYDDAGLLSRVKRETERGVMTIQEGRTVLVPNNEID